MRNVTNSLRARLNRLPRRAAAPNETFLECVLDRGNPELLSETDKTTWASWLEKDKRDWQTIPDYHHEFIGLIANDQHSSETFEQFKARRFAEWLADPRSLKAPEEWSPNQGAETK